MKSTLLILTLIISLEGMAASDKSKKQKKEKSWADNLRSKMGSEFKGPTRI